jgi:hypothetical protein
MEPDRPTTERGRDRDSERASVRDEDRASREEWQVRVTLDAVDLERGTVKGVMRTFFVFSLHLSLPSNW